MRGFRILKLAETPSFIMTIFWFSPLLTEHVVACEKKGSCFVFWQARDGCKWHLAFDNRNFFKAQPRKDEVLFIVAQFPTKPYKYSQVVGAREKNKWCLRHNVLLSKWLESCACVWPQKTNEFKDRCIQMSIWWMTLLKKSNIWSVGWCTMPIRITFLNNLDSFMLETLNEINDGARRARIMF